jgi:hypothetical protein
MSVNRYLPHVFVLPEDDANRQIANGFLLDELLRGGRIRVLEEAGGWQEVLDRFCSIYAREMERFPERRMILLIDCDGQTTRLAEAMRRIPTDLQPRVFILGVLTEPERLKADLGSYEQIGLAVASDCREGTGQIWQHRLLEHNWGEVERMRRRIRPILFP